MNDQTSPTADGQGPGSSQWRNPYEEPQNAQALPRVPDRVPAGSGGPAGPGGYDGYGATGVSGPSAAVLVQALPDLLVAGVLLVVGAVLGVLSGLVWYHVAPTVWLTVPANAVSQVTSAVDQSQLLVEPEGKGIASVDGYFFVITAIVGVLLAVLGFFLARRGFLGERDRGGDRGGAALGAWAGVLFGGLAASGTAAAIGRLVSMPDPLKVLHTIAAGHNFHAPVALHAQGLYLAAPLVGSVLYFALTAAFTSPPSSSQRQDDDGVHSYLPAAKKPPRSRGRIRYLGGAAPTATPTPPQTQTQPQPDQNGQPGTRPGDDGPGTNSGTPQADNSIG